MKAKNRDKKAKASGEYVDENQSNSRISGFNTTLLKSVGRKKRRNVFSGLCIILLLFVALTFIATVSADDPPCTCGDICVNETGWWRAGADFNASNTPIQHAINNATAGNTICVKDDTYSENVNVNKRLMIRSENGTANCVVNALRSSDHVFKVTRDYVNISGFTVHNAAGFEKAGIYLGSGIEHCNISDNNASNSYCGIYLDGSRNNTLTNNIANSNYYGILLYLSSNYNTLSNNSANLNYYGILLGDSRNNTLTNNIANSNSHDGIYLVYSSNNTLSNNTASNNLYGIRLYPSSNYNTLSNNTANSNYYGIYLESSSSNTLSNNTANSNSHHGIYLYRWSNYNTLSNNTANSNNEYGIYLYSSSNNNLTNNTAKENSEFDLYIFADSGSYCNNKIENMTGSGNRPIRYYNSSVSLSDVTLSELILCNADQSNINNVTIEGSATKKNNGVLLVSTDFSNLTSINSSNNSYGIYLLSSSNNNTLSNNTANSNSHGIYLGYSSNNNTLSNNTASNNNYDFYSDESSHSNTVEDLTIASYPTTISFIYDQGIKINGVRTPELNPAGKVNISKFVNATNVTADSWIFLNVSYRNADVSGVDEDSLLLYRWNETASAWELANETGKPNGVNTTGNYVYANVTSFSQIAPFGNPTPQNEYAQ